MQVKQANEKTFHVPNQKVRDLFHAKICTTCVGIENEELWC